MKLRTTFIIIIIIGAVNNPRSLFKFLLDQGFLGIENATETKSKLITLINTNMSIYSPQKIFFC